MKHKISYYLSHPIQYFSPLLKKMSEEFDLHVYYFSDASIKGNMDVGFNQEVQWDVPLLDGYRYTFLKNISRRKSLSNRMWDVINPSVIRTLYKNKSEIIIVNGWSYFSNLLTIFGAKILRKRVCLRADNPLNQELKKSKITLFVKKIVLKQLLFPFIDHFLYVGSESRKFFEYYGAKSSKLIFTPHTVANEKFIAIKSKIWNDVSLKREMGLPIDKNIILFTGKYIEKKRPMDLIKAFHLLKDRNTLLIMVGEGKLRPEMESYIASKKIKNVILTGFINQSEIVKYYSIADLFVMCSGIGETWGLSVNEAMCFSLPVLVSETTGCSTDLVENGINGFTFKEGDITTLATAIKKLLENEDLRKQCGAASLKIIHNYSNDHIVSNLKEAFG